MKRIKEAEQAVEIEEFLGDMRAFEKEETHVTVVMFSNGVDSSMLNAQVEVERDNVVGFSNKQTDVIALDMKYVNKITYNSDSKQIWFTLMFKSGQKVVITIDL